MSDVIDLLEDLIRRPSITPEDAGCQSAIIKRMSRHGFAAKQYPFKNVKNVHLFHGDGSPVMLFLGHTDVVPTGPLAQWHSPPFEPTQRDGLLYGRGAADMKSGVAAMVCALERFVSEHPGHAGQVGLLLTSDEEGPAQHGVRAVADHWQGKGQLVDYCVVGEASSKAHLGDRIRVGRRGSLNGLINIFGHQGHTAYPELADNPVHRFAPALAELITTTWDEGDAAFPATACQIANINAGTGATNVIPGSLEATINFRYGPASTADSLKHRCQAVLAQYTEKFEIEWSDSGKPFITEDGPLRQAAVAAVQSVCGREPVTDTGGGTSDGRFIAPLGAQVVEIGPVNASIHQINEHVRTADVEQLVLIYRDILTRLMT